MKRENKSNDRPNDRESEVARVAREMASRLRAKGIAVNDGDPSHDIVQLMEAVEAFERAVESHGGDLMVDEPPGRGTAQPDDPHFLLPPRAASESVDSYIRKLQAATSGVRKHKPHPPQG